jgi:hypothetical protein
MQTIVGLETRDQSRAAVWAKRGFLTLLLAFVLAGLAGLLGVRTTTASDESGTGWELHLRHAEVARAGLDVPWEVTVHHDGGFGKEIVLAVTGAYLDIYETQGFTPEPTESTRDADTLLLTFAAPPGDTFVLAYDAYIQPAAQQGADGTVAVLDDGVRVASVDFSTTVLP